MRVVTAPPEGTTFRLYCPETRRREMTASPATVGEAPRGRKTLRLVEDEAQELLIRIQQILSSP